MVIERRIHPTPRPSPESQAAQGLPAPFDAIMGPDAARPVRPGKTIDKAAENARDGRHQKKTGLSTDLDFGCGRIPSSLFGRTTSSCHIGCDRTSPFFQKGTPAVNLSRHAEKAAPGNPTGSIPTQNRPIALTLIHAD